RGVRAHRDSSGGGRRILNAPCATCFRAYGTRRLRAAPETQCHSAQAGRHGITIASAFDNAMPPRAAGSSTAHCAYTVTPTPVRCTGTTTAPFASVMRPTLKATGKGTTVPMPAIGVGLFWLENRA